MGIWAAHMYLHHVCAWGGGKKVSGPLELKLEIVMSSHVGAESQTSLFWKSTMFLSTDPSLYLQR